MNNLIRNIAATVMLLLCVNLIPDQTKAQTTVGFSIVNKTVTEKDTFTVAVRADSLLTGKNIYSYRFSLTYNAGYLEFLGIDSVGIVLKNWGLPAFNDKTSGTILIAGAGSVPLSGSGEMFFLKFRAKQGGGTYIQSTSTTQSYLNEGLPAMTVSYGYIQANSRSYPDIYPDNQALFVGEELQMYVSGGLAPYVYRTADTAIAVISGLTRVKAKGPGLTKVSVTDAHGEVSYTSGNIDVRAVKLSVLHSTAWPRDTFYIPIRIEVAPGTRVYSGSFNLSFNGNIQGIKESVRQGDFPVSVQNNAGTNQVRVSFASASGLTGTGILCYIGFKAINSGSHYVSIENALFNESLLSFVYNEYAEINYLPTLNISPDGGSFMWGETQKITVSNGIPPLTFAVSDADVASIDALGNLYGKTGGKVKVTVTDLHGATRTSSDFLIYHNRFSIANTDGELDKDTRVPITTSMLPSGKAVYAIEGNVGFNPDLLEFRRVDPAVPGMLVEAVNNGNSVYLVGACSQGVSNGNVCYLVFRLKNSMALNQETPLTLTNFTANESALNSTLSGGKVRRVAQVSYRPIAVAGVNLRINEGELVTLDASASYDEDNDPLTYRWIAPAGIKLDDSTSVKPHFTAPLVNVNTNYIFTLIVNDGGSDSDPVQVTVTVLQVNKVPVANAGSDRNVIEGSTVSLDGSLSYDPDGEALSFQWSSLDGIILFDPTSAAPSFIAPQVNADKVYRFRLVVRDGIANSLPDTVAIKVLQVNKKPVAFAGGDQTVNEGDVVNLDGSLSSDPDGDAITYLWTAPANVTLSSKTIAKPSFTAPAVHRDSTLTISLVVNDGVLNSEMDYLVITVKNVDILSTEAQILKAELPQADSVVVNQKTMQVTLYMPYGYDIRTLAPTFTISNKATISPNSGVVRNFTSPLTYTVIAEDGVTQKVYQVRVNVPDFTLRRSLDAGWNWISLSLDPPNTELSNLFNGLSLVNLDYLKSATSSAVYYSGSGWFGDLKSMPKSEMVKFKKSTSAILTISGKEINPTLTYIPVSSGWNRIGYLLKGNCAVNSAFDAATLPTGDLLLKSKDASAVYYPASGWVGDLDSLRVLTGYMMKATANGNFRYNPGGAKLKSVSVQYPVFRRAELYNRYQIAPESFDNSAILIGEIVNEKGGNIVQAGDLLLAYIKGEARGVCEALYIEDLNRYLFIMTIFSDTNDEITLQLKSNGNGNEIILAEKYNFAADAVYGSAFNPDQMHLTQSNVNPVVASLVQMYPNPFGAQLTLKSGVMIKTITMYNALGECILALPDVSADKAQIATGSLSPGVYVLKVATADGMVVSKLLKSGE